MSIITSPLLLGADSGIYQISRSLRFNAPDSAYLSRNFASAPATSWTISMWVKRSKLTDPQYFFSPRINGYEAGLIFHTDDRLRWYNTDGSTNYDYYSTAVFRDVAAWYHIVMRVSAGAFTIYVNNASHITGNLAGGVQSGTWLLGSITPSLYFFNGYLADIHFIDGQALDPSSFTTTDLTTGQLVPKAFTGSYGTNGFRLAFDSYATTAALGTDTSGNGNTWTVNNFSVTAGSGNDSLVDTPTSYGTDTGVGGEVRGNYATFNPINLTPSSSHALTNGNLEVIGGTGWTTDLSTFPTGSTGKWYAEITLSGTFATTPFVGIAQDTSITNSFMGSQPTSYGYRADATKYNNGVSAAYGATFAAGDTIGIAYDADAGTLVFYKNGVSQGTAYSGLSGSFFIGGSFWTSSTTVNAVANFGQRTFSYAAPAGYKCLVDTNLPAPVVAKPNTLFDVVLYTGTGAALTPTSSLGFNPDWIWIKSRSAATDHALYDVVRGAQARLESNTTDAEVTTDGGVTAFNSAGFTLGTLAQVNTSSATYAAWCWDAGTSTVSNTAGSITSQVRANVSAGFSIVTYTGNSVQGATVGHGLGVVPSMVIYKGRVGSLDWLVYHASLGATQGIYLNQTLGATTSANFFNNTAPNSSTLYLNSSPPAGQTNETGYTYVAYCFAPVVGYSSFGSYTGNGSDNGPFVYTGFKVKWLMIKRTDSTSNWYMIDAARSPYNEVNDLLYAEQSLAETADDANNGVDFLSNGFKLRKGVGGTNINGSTLIYAAFAENPFQYARAR